jgi:hypothetical protein
MFIEHDSTRFDLGNAVIGLLLLGVIYQQQFRHRKDWLTLESHFSHAEFERYFWS